jgi:hypothetical protein
MEKLDAFLQPFALWLGLGLIKAGIVMGIVAVIVIVWNGTTDGDSLGD